MSNWLDANTIVTLCQKQALAKLADLPGPWLVPEYVDKELSAHADKYPEQARQYQEAKAQKLIQVVPMPTGSPGYNEYQRLRLRRTSLQRNQGDDACVALALTVPGSTVWTGDNRGANRARAELGDPSRVRTREDLLALLGL